MDARRPWKESHLFLLRLWIEVDEEGRDKEQWCGRVQHILSGEAHTFRDWLALADLLTGMAQSYVPSRTWDWATTQVRYEQSRGEKEAQDEM